MKRPASAAFALILTVGLTDAATPAEGPTFRVDPGWPQPLPERWILGAVSGITTDAQGNVWIVQRPRSLTDDERGAATTPPQSTCCIPAPPVIQFDRAGKVIGSWGGPGQGFDWPGSEHGIAIDPDGNVWLAGNANVPPGTPADSGIVDGTVLKFTAQGKFLLQIGRPGPATGSSDTSRLGRPTDFAFDRTAREVYVADGYLNHRVIVFDSQTGAFRRMWGAYGKAPTDAKLPQFDTASPQFGLVHCVRIADDGLVYVCDRSNNRVQVFRKDGSYVREFAFEPATRGNGSVWDLVLWPAQQQRWMLVADGTNNEIRVTRREDGVVVSRFGRSGRNAGQFHWVHNLALDDRGNLFTTEVDNAKRVQKWIPASR